MDSILADKSDAFFSAVVEHSPDCIKILDSDDRIAWISPRGLELLEADSPGQLEGLEWSELWTLPGDRETARMALETARAGGVGRFEASYPTFGGLEKWWNVAVVPLPAEPGKGVRMLSIWRDVTDRRAIEERLRESEERFRNMADHAPVMIWIAGVDGLCSYLSKSWYEFTGMPSSPDKIADWQSAVHPDDLPAVEAQLREAHRQRSGGPAEYRARRHDGQYRWLLDTAVQRRDGNGRFAGYVGSMVDITEEKEAHRRKDRFLATLAHELRNPLAPILTGLEVIRTSLSDPDAISKVTAMMARQTGQMVHLIDDLLDMARINAGKIMLQKSRIPLDDILRGAVEASRPLIDERGHRFEMDSREPGLEVEVDFHRIAQVVSNLLSNAAKYTPPGGLVRLVSGVDDKDCPWISVSDNGDGIEESHHGKIFELFEQVDHGRQDGLGIGLTLVKTLVDLHGGSIEVKSGGLGLGSEFVVRLPYCPPGGMIPIPESNRQETAEVVHSGSWQRVMVVEDSKNTADILAMFFEMEGRQVVVAYDGEEAVRKAEHSLPELILMDLGMPRMDGFEAARRIRSLPGAQAVTLVALSGWGQPQDKERSREAGFNEHLVKPVSPTDLRLLLQRLDADRAGRP